MARRGAAQIQVGGGAGAGVLHRGKEAVSPLGRGPKLTRSCCTQGHGRPPEHRANTSAHCQG